MTIVTSTQNRLVKLAHSLSMKKCREELGLMLLEGGNLIKDLPDGVRIRYAFAVEERVKELEKLHAEEAYVVTDAVMQKITDTVSPYGVAVICDIPRFPFAPPKGNALLLDSVADPGNLGTIFRTAVACGFEDVYMLGCADAFSPKTVRASLGGVLKLRLYTVDEDEAAELARSLDSCALDMDGQDIFGFKAEGNVLIIAGNEARGISQNLRQAAKHTLSLPMRNGMESLNVAIATAVAMYKFIGE